MPEKNPLQPENTSSPATKINQMFGTRVCLMFKEMDELKLEDAPQRSSVKSFPELRKRTCSPGYKDHADPLWRLWA